jgi:hypothetical protein
MKEFIKECMIGNSKSVLNYIINDLPFNNKTSRNFDPYFINNKTNGVFDVDIENQLNNRNKYFTRCSTCINKQLGTFSH